MVYLDYSATTPVNKEVLESFNKASLDFLEILIHYINLECNQKN